MLQAYLVRVLGHTVLADKAAVVGHLEAGVVLNVVGTLVDVVLVERTMRDVQSRAESQVTRT